MFVFIMLYGNRFADLESRISNALHSSEGNGKISRCIVIRYNSIDRKIPFPADARAMELAMDECGGTMHANGIQLVAKRKVKMWG